MIPSRLDVKTRFRSLLDDDAGKVFTDAVFAQAFNEAYEVMVNALFKGQTPAIRNIVVWPLNALVTSLIPADAGITDFADYVMLRERRTGSADLFRQLESREVLTQRSPTDRLLEFVWRINTFFFVGATNNIDLEITYEASGTPPTDDGTSIGIDNSSTFLSNYAAAVAGGRKGYDEIAQRCWNVAVGPKHTAGQLGGALFDMVQFKVRSEQKTQIALRPFSTFRRGINRQVPYIAAQQPQGIGMAPAQFSTSNGTITGAVDGVNATFFLAYPVSTAVVYRSGVLMTQPSDVVFGANQLVFQAGQIPQFADVITVEGWI